MIENKHNKNLFLVNCIILLFVNNSIIAQSINTYQTQIKLVERHVYGSEQVGIDYAITTPFFDTTFQATLEEDGTLRPVNNGNKVEVSELINQQTIVDYTAPQHLIKAEKKYAISNHLGNVLTTINDLKLGEDLINNDGVVDDYHASVESANDYYPFGMGMFGRDISGEYRMGFQGQEMDDEVKGDGNSANFKYRMHDARVGRFFGVDPLAAKFPYNSPYAFSENVVLNAIELEGLEKVQVISLSFAPFDYFGLGFSGDGKDRKFGDMAIGSKDGFRIAAAAYFDVSNSNLIAKKAFGAWTKHSGAISFSEAEFNYFTLASNYLSFAFSGSNSLAVGSPDIDVRVTTEFKLSDDKRKLRVRGSVTGDKFPSNETFIADNSGNRLFLSVSGLVGSRNFGPFSSLPGEGDEDMGFFDFNILLDEKENFIGAELKNGTTYTVDEWNKFFTDFDPKDGGVSTFISEDKVKKNVNDDENK